MRVLLSFLVLCACTGCQGGKDPSSSQLTEQSSIPSTNISDKENRASVPDASDKPVKPPEVTTPAQPVEQTVPKEAPGGKKTICLNMIVKDEEPVITRCLGSVKPIIDYWVIVDTGSSDKTKEVIREFMKDIPGELHERPWKNFEHNRNEALELAKGKADYLLIMDADDHLQFDPSFKLPVMNLDSYRMWIKYGGHHTSATKSLARARPGNGLVFCMKS